MKNFIALLMVFVYCQCGKKQSVYMDAHKELIKEILEDDGRFYDLDKKVNHNDVSLPVGVFDSGIGGLSVFDVILNADNFNKYNDRQSDGAADFKHESFIYLADQANMPYSNYVEVGKTGLLEEFILKDFLFLVNQRYHSMESINSYKKKQSVKTIVIACNTATAYGKAFIDDFIKSENINIKVIGVIDAGVTGALEIIQKEENATIAIFATPATVHSQAYVNTLEKLIGKNGYRGNIQIVQQGGKGLHESIDNKQDFISSDYIKPYKSYQGPSFSNLDYKIEKDLLSIYNFDTLNHSMLIDHRNYYSADSIQINSVENYVRYHMVSLVEKIRSMPGKQPLKVIILGCTHYPFVEKEIQQVIAELKMNKRYAGILTNQVILIDPAKNTAIELYKYLSGANLLNTDRLPSVKDYFFTSVPNTLNPKVEINEYGTFTYDYQYIARDVNNSEQSTLIVPLSEKVISTIQLKQIEEKYPKTYHLIKLNRSN